jgi:uncharacterized protein (TIGR02453 family)
MHCWLQSNYLTSISQSPPMTFFARRHIRVRQGMSQFRGFPKDFFAFFRELKANNNRGWFEINKPRFRESVQAPMSEFIASMAPRLNQVSKNFVADPRPNGGSMFRIYRDVRFSKDKRPYKEHAACHFRHAVGKDAHAPGFYMHFAPDDVFFGGGLWMPPADTLAKVRTAIATESASWKRMVSNKKFASRFDGVDGESLSRPPRGFDASHPLIEDIKRKSFFAMHEGSVILATSPKLVDEVAETFVAASPLMKFLCDALDAPF